MFNNHTISVIFDLNVLGPAINDRDFLVVASITTTERLPDAPTIFNAGILTPPTEMLMRWADGPDYILQNEYPAYLMTKEPDDFIVALLAALTKKNIVLYFNKNDFELFGKILLEHLYMYYGIICNFNGAVFNILPDKIPLIISKFYAADLMSPNEYLAMYPGNMLLPQFVIYKLAEDLHPFNYPAQYVEYERYFNQLNASKLTAKVEMMKVVDKK